MAEARVSGGPGPGLRSERRLEPRPDSELDRRSLRRTAALGRAAHTLPVQIRFRFGKELTCGGQCLGDHVIRRAHVDGEPPGIGVDPFSVERGHGRRLGFRSVRGPGIQRCCHDNARCCRPRFRPQLRTSAIGAQLHGIHMRDVTRQFNRDGVDPPDRRTDVGAAGNRDAGCQHQNGRPDKEPPHSSHAASLGGHMPFGSGARPL